MKKFAAFRLDDVNQCLWRRTGSGDDERILLSPREFGVLDRLLENAGRLVTHQQLLDAVWPGTAIEPQAVKSTIFQLRRALDDDPKHPRFIETIPRRGYRFLANIELRRAVEEALGAKPASKLVGREGALTELSQCMRSAIAARLQIVFITGEAGIGKTALAEAFQRHVAASNATMLVARGQCVEGFGSKEPFFPVLTAVGELCAGPDAARVVETLATHAPTWLVQFPALVTQQHRELLRQEILGATRVRMLREICQALEAIAARTPLLLVFEDLHWADASTLDLISALARCRTPARIMLAATYRPTDAARSTQPLHSLKRDLVARQLCREIVLQPLTEAEIGQYLAAGKPTAEVEELAALLHRHTEGNPLFMIAVLEHLADLQLVECEHGSWRSLRTAADVSVQVPDSLRGMLGTQIEGLREQEQRVLEVAAIAGTSFAPTICAPSADIEIGVFDECCDALARRGLMLRLDGTRELPDGSVVQRYQFAHALYREVFYDRQSLARRTMLHRRLAERLEVVFAGALDDVTPELALHFEKGGNCSRAVKYLRRVADLAADHCALEEARANLQRALELASRLPLSERAAAQAEILDTLAELYLGSFDPRAADALTLLRERAAKYGLVDFEAKALVDLVYPLSWVSSERALEVIEQALQLSEAQADPLMRARTRAQCMMRRIWTRGWRAADATECANALAEIRRCGQQKDVAWHVIDCNLLDFFSSSYRKAMRETVEHLAILVEGHRGSLYLSYPYSVREFTVPWCLTLLGEWGSALREFDAGIALAEKNGDPLRGQTLLLFRCLALLFAMDFASVRAISESLLPALHDPARAPWRRFCLTLSGMAAVGLGNHEAGLDRLGTAREEMDRRPALGDWYWRLLQQSALTSLWLSTGDLARARKESELFLADATATAERTWQALAWEANARVELASGNLRRAQDLVANSLTAIEGFEAPVAKWQVHATAADVANASGDLPAAMRHLEASRTIVHELAGSLGPNEQAVQRTFLTSPAVARVAGEGALLRSHRGLHAEPAA
jgi:DNA-binding winged helix-turn-helix (wHTH) protein